MKNHFFRIFFSLIIISFFVFTNKNELLKSFFISAQENSIGIIGLNRFRLLDGNQYNSPATLIVNNNLQTQKSNTLYTSFIARNWPSGIAGKTQWSHFILANPNGNAANVTIKVYSAHNGAGKTNGQLLATIQRNIPPYGWFNSYNDNDLNNLPDNYDADGIQTLAWAEITSNQPLIGIDRFRLLDGNQYNSPATLMVDNNLQTQKSNTLYTSLITRNWFSTNVGKTQWSHIFLANPNGNAANVTIKVYSAHNGAGKTNGQLLATIQRNIPPYGFFNSLNDLNNLPDNHDADGIQTLAWAEINSFGSTSSACAKKNLGDANCDGNINDVDYDIWKCEFLGGGICKDPSSQKAADFNLDTKVDLIDFEIWRSNSFAPASTPNSTPTPTTTSNPTQTSTPTPTPTRISTPTPTPTTISTPTSTPRPTATPAFGSSNLVVPNFGLGISCNELCSLAQERCLGAGTDPQATNNRFAVYRNNRCTILYNMVSSCTVNLGNNFTYCSDNNGNNSDRNPHQADWTYCRCSNSHSSITCTSDSQCPSQKVCASGRCVIPSCGNVNSCQFVNFNNHRCEVLNKPNGSRCVIYGVAGECNAGNCIPFRECQTCITGGYCPDYCSSPY